MLVLKIQNLPENCPAGGVILLTLKISKKINHNLFNIRTYSIDAFMYESEDAFKQTKLTSTYIAKKILPSDLLLVVDKKQLMSSI